MTWIGSPNYTLGRQGNRVTGVIIHWIVGDLASADRIFQDRNRNTSAHYGVEDGNVHQYVKEEDTAYHAGNWNVNLQTIGIEHSAAPGRPASDATYEASAQLIAAAAKRFGFAINSSTVRKHSAIIATQCPGTIDLERLINRANQIAGGSVPTTPTPPVPTNPVGRATVTVPVLMVRSAPNTSAALSGSRQLTQGQTFDYLGAVQGQMVNGVSTWLKSTRGNYVWAGGTNVGTTPSVPAPAGGTAQAIRDTNVRAAPTTASAISGSGLLRAGQTFKYTAIVSGQNVAQNGVTSNQWYRSEFGHYVWSGNLRKV